MTLTEQLAPRAAMLEDLEDKVGSGKLPVGTIATVLKRPYAEIHLLWSATNGTYLHRPDRDTTQREDAALTAAVAANGAAVLIDATALTTLTWLSDQTRSECLTAVGAQITRATFNDLRQARDNLARPSSGTFSYDTRLERVVFTDADQQQARTIAAAAAEMVDLAATMPRIRVVSDSDLQLRGDTRSWLGLVATCRREGLTLWNDVVLREIAVAEQVPAFGTYALLVRLHTDGILTSADHEAALFDLTQHRALDLPIPLERLRLVASIDRWRPEAAALVLTRAAAWTNDTSTCLSLLAEACTQRSTDPGDLASWAASATRGICAAIPDVDQAAPAAASILGTPGLTAAVVRAILNGTRVAAERAGVADPGPKPSPSSGTPSSATTPARKCDSSSPSCARASTRLIKARRVMPYWKPADQRLRPKSIRPRGPGWAAVDRGCGCHVGRIAQ